MKLKNIWVCVTAVLSILGISTQASAESPLTGNIGFTSNYIWRGVTQSGDDSAISGGIDYVHESGFYAGTWVSSLGGGNQYENDIYFGYGFKAGPIDLDVGYITYRYPVSAVQADFDEIYVNAGWQLLNFGAAYTVSSEAGGQDSDLYLYLGATFDLKPGLSLSLTYGEYDFDDSAKEDYGHFQVALHKDDFTFAIDKNDMTDTGAGEDDMRISVSYSKSFDLL